MTMTFEKATAQDTGMLTELRIAYLQEDLGEIEAVDLELIESFFPILWLRINIQNSPRLPGNK